MGVMINLCLICGLDARCFTFRRQNVEIFRILMLLFCVYLVEWCLGSGPGQQGVASLLPWQVATHIVHASCVHALRLRRRHESMSCLQVSRIATEATNPDQGVLP